MLGTDKMPYRCCVPGCKGNYPTGPKVQVFSFPKEEQLLEKWKRAIPRENSTISKTTRVCEQHFHLHEIIRTSLDNRRNGAVPRTLTRPSLLSTAVPSLFPNCRHYLSKHGSYCVGPEGKRQKLEEGGIQAAVQKSLKERKSAGSLEAIYNHSTFELPHLQREMDQEVEIKEEPVWLEGTADTSLEIFDLESALIRLKEETKPEFMEPEQTQISAYIKEEITIEEHTIDQLVPFSKEENSVENVAVLTTHSGEMVQ